MGHRNAGVIRHYGIVEKVSGHLCTVRILQASACQGCATKNLCSVSDSKEKLVEARTCGKAVAVGQSVCVEGSVRQGMKAVLLGYVVPLVVMVAVLCLATLWLGELAGAFAALLSLGAYFNIIYLLRNKIGKRFVFRISDDVQ